MGIDDHLMWARYGADYFNNIVFEYIRVLTTSDTLALKSEIEAYGQKNDLLSYTDTTCMKEATFEKSGNLYMLDLSYVEGTHVTIKYEDTTYCFTFTIDEQGSVGTNTAYIHNIDDALMMRWIDRPTKSSLYLHSGSNNAIVQYELLSVIYPGPDELALKSEIEALKEENTALKMQIAALQVRYP